jgi:3-oxoadipate enol-lactonase/4-carboxymuconolactone decarboxylase
VPAVPDPLPIIGQWAPELVLHAAILARNTSQSRDWTPYVQLVHPSVDEGPRRVRGTAGATTAAVGAPVVVLLHGQPGTAGDWYRVVPLLSTDHRVIAVDRPGYTGDPALARDWSGNADALLAMLDGLGIGKVVVVGASWAGGVAIELAVRAPERLHGIVFAASVGGGGAITLFDRLAAVRPLLAIGARVAQHASSSLAAPLSRAAGSRLDEEAVREARLSIAVWRERRVWTAAALEQRFLVRDDELLRAMVPCADIPTVVVQGTRDITLPPRAGIELAAALPNARLIEVPAGHMLSLEEPGTLAAAVRSLTTP